MSVGRGGGQVVALFGATKVPYGDSKQLVRGITVACGHCPATETLPVNNFSGRNREDNEPEFQFIKRKLESRGWKIGDKISQHRCPKCLSVVRAANTRRTSETRAATDGEAHMTVTPIKPPTEVGQRLMGRDDRRIIFAKLNEVYVGDKVGYGDGWSDEKVATDLGVPRAWVRLIRDENFGDEMASDAIRQVVAEAEALMADIKVAAPLAAEVMGRMKRLTDEAERISKSLDAVRKAVGAG